MLPHLKGSLRAPFEVGQTRSKEQGTRNKEQGAPERRARTQKVAGSRRGLVQLYSVAGDPIVTTLQFVTKQALGFMYASIRNP
jgi:hypothetical protein